jgi:hypothetical protein
MEGGAPVAVTKARARMPTGRKKPHKNIEWLESSGPDVIVDFVFDDGLFFISIRNISDRPAYKVSVKFDRRICRLDGRDLAGLPLFQNIEFLAPHKEIAMFLDDSGSYFRKGGPTKVSARISYHDARGTRKVATIHHDLEIYKAIGFIRRVRDQD